MAPTQVELGNYQKGVEEEKPASKPFNLMQFLKEVKVEFLKISWPSKAQATTEFFTVLLLVSVITGIIYVIDKVFGIILNFFTGRTI